MAKRSAAAVEASEPNATRSTGEQAAAAKRAPSKSSARVKKAKIEVDVLGKHSSHRTAGGVLMTFGMGDMGQLGYEAEGRKKPKIIPALEDVSVVAVECGGMHTAALSADGKVYTWGVNDEGALGREGDELEPTVVAGAIEGKRIIQIGCGDSHTVALAQDGTVYHWGIYRDAQGKFGLQPDTPKEIYKQPVEVAGLAGKTVVRLVSGADHVLALTSSGELLSWGCFEQGRLGRLPEKVNRDVHKKSLTPGQVTFKFRGQTQYHVVDMGAGSFHSFAILAHKKNKGEAKLFAWGANGKGQLGLDNGDDEEGNRFFPEEVKFLSDHKIQPAHVTAGNAHSLVLAANKEVYATGKGTDGVLGVGSEEHTLDGEGRNKWVKVEALADKNVAEVACGAEVSYALTAQGGVYAWGFGENMQLGNGAGADEETESLLSPTKLEGQALEGQRVLQISAGGQHVALIASR